jgi:hypothetical protein
MFSFKSIVFILIAFIISSKVNAQTINNKIITNHSYIFSGVLSQDKITSLENQLMRIEFISEAKIKYKPEKNIGQILFTTQEKPTTKEGDKSFSPTSVKQLLIQNNLTPTEYSQLKP